jgi:hypothetical protein
VRDRILYVRERICCERSDFYVRERICCERSVFVCERADLL